MLNEPIQGSAPVVVVAQNRQERVLLQELEQLLLALQPLFSQQRVFQRVVLLLVGEVLTLARHTVTQMLMTLGWVDRDWSAWYRLFRKKRFPYPALARKLLEEFPGHVRDGWLIVGGDATTTRRSSRKMRGMAASSGCRSLCQGAGLAATLVPFGLAYTGGGWYSRAIPILWIPAFTPRSRRRKHPARPEVKAALVALRWLRLVLKAPGKETLRVLMVGDGRYDHRRCGGVCPRV